MNEWTNGLGRLDRLVDGRTDFEQAEGLVDGRMNLLVDGWMDEWMNECMQLWMDGRTSFGQTDGRA